jgi:hypothetical protein
MSKEVEFSFVRDLRTIPKDVKIQEAQRLLFPVIGAEAIFVSVWAICWLVGYRW